MVSGKISYPKMRALVALSNQQLARYIVLFLRDKGAAAVHTVYHSDAAVSRVSRFSNYTHFFIDYDLEGVGGLEFCRYIRLMDGEVSESPILMAIAHPDRNKVFACRDAGVNEMLAVPFTPKKLQECLQRTIDEPRPFIRVDTYIGPCRRRFFDQGYGGVNRRADEAKISAA